MMVRASAVVLVVILILAAGCAGNREPEPITDTATEVTVTDDARSQAGFTHQTTDRPRFTTRGQATISGDVQMTLQYRFNATTHRTIYWGEDTPNPGPRVYATWSVPLIEPSDVALTVDPLRNMETADLVSRGQDRYSDVRSVTPAAERNLSVQFLGSDVAVGRFTATATYRGSTTPVTLYVARVTHEGDVVSAIAIAPRGSLDPTIVRRLLEGTRH